jgi:hypothetical protein
VYNFDPVPVRIAHEAQPRPTLADRVRRALGLDALRLQVGERRIQILDADGDVLVGWWWADPLAGLVIGAVAVREGREAWRGEKCGDGCC